MRSLVLSLVVLLHFSLLLHGQPEVLDSLRRAYASATDDSVRWELTKTLFSEFTRVQVDSSLYYAEQAYALAQRTKIPRQLGLSYDILGRAYILQNQYQRGQEYLIEASNIYRDLEEEELLVDVEAIMAKIFLDIGDFDNAEKYLRRALDYHAQFPDRPNILAPLIRFGMLYERREIPDSVLYYTQEALKVGERLQLAPYLATLHNNVADGYLGVNDFAQAEYHFRKSIEMGHTYDPSTLDNAALGLADLYSQTGEIDSSLHYSLLTSEWAVAYGDQENEAAGYEMTAENYALKNDFENAYAYRLKFSDIRDSMMLDRHSRDLSELNVKYETRTKEAQIAQQQLLLEQETNRRNLILFGSVALLALATAVFLYLRNRQRAKQRQAQLELQLQRAEAEKLKELDRMKSNFFANISHEFRTPLTLILGPLREMQEKTFQGNPQQYYRMMIRNGERLLRLVNQLLELARLESGHTKLDTQAVDLTDFLRPIVASFENWAMRKQIYFQIVLPNRPVSVFIDPDKVEKAVVNLLSNAFKFTPEEGRIRFELKATEGEQPEEVLTEFVVSDTGIGIPENHLPHIFDRFYTQAKMEDEMGNIGIGLALTKELVELHGGTIDVVSSVKQGTTFTVRLPLKTAPPQSVSATSTSLAATEPILIESTTSSGTTSNGNRPTVLVVEDHPDLRRYIQDHLREHYEVIEAVNGEQGLELATERIPDLIISDIVMPRLDGLELCKRLKAEEKTSHIPIILLTARADQEDKLAGLSRGADVYLTKPFDAKELGLRVEKLIERNRQLRKKFATAQNGITINTSLAHPEEEAFLSKVLRVIETHLDDESFSIEELGRALGMSRSQLHRKIKALTDQSPSVFLRTVRLQHAYQLLERKTGNVSEIAFRVGFSNLPYFSRTFSNQFGFPPSALLQR